MGAFLQGQAHRTVQWTCGKKKARLCQLARHMTASLQFNISPVAEPSSSLHAPCDVYM